MEKTPLLLLVVTQTMFINITPLVIGWTQLSPFPGGMRGYSHGVGVGKQNYVGFGSDTSSLYPNDWWEYDMLNDSWTQLSSFPGDGRNHPTCQYWK